MTTDAPASRFTTMKPGDVTGTGDVVAEVLTASQEYCIFVSDKNVLRFIANAGVMARANGITDILARITALKVVTPHNKRALDRQIGRGVVLALEGDPAAALACLSRIHERLAKTRQSLGRVVYVLSSLGVVLIPLALYLVGAFGSVWVPEAQRYISFCLMGALGAFLSVMLGLRELTIDVDDPRAITITHGASRILIGVVAAVAAALMVEAGILLSAASESPQALRVTTLAAGFSESLIPNALKGSASGGQQ